MARTAEAWAKLAQQYIGYCYSDQPHEPGFDWALGRRTEIHELLESLNVPERSWESVAAKLHCPYCGNGGFDTNDEVGTYTPEELADEKRSREWYQRWQPKLNAFGEYLAKYPYLGAKHAVGRHIIKAINDLPVRNVINEVWWRARQPEGGRHFSRWDMFPPPPDKATVEGRYNHYGQVVFYLASTAEAALLEVVNREKSECLAWVQRFHVVCLEKVLDLAADNEWWEDDPRSVLTAGLVTSLIHLAPQSDLPWRPEYFVPRFVADSAREKGLHAILFHSRRHFAKNLVVFDPKHPAIVPDGEPKILLMSKKTQVGRIEEITEYEPEF